MSYGIWGWLVLILAVPLYFILVVGGVLGVVAVGTLYGYPKMADGSAVGLLVGLAVAVGAAGLAFLGLLPIIVKGPQIVTWLLDLPAKLVGH